MSRDKIEWNRFNPWINSTGSYTEEFKTQVDLYIEKDSSTSWLAKKEQEIQDDQVVAMGKKFKKSINYGIPTLVKGDFKNSDIFICLYNPATQVGYKTGEENEPSSLHSNEEDLDSYIELECGKYKEEYLPSEYKEDKYDWHYKHIINEKKDILSLELAAMKEFGREPINDEERKAYYYLYQYFYPLFGEKRLEVFHNLYEKIKSQEIPNFNLVNIELVPYRSKNKADIQLKKGKTHYDLGVSKFAASIVVNRILVSLVDENKKKPIFIFRSFTEWSETIDRFIADERNSEYISGVLGAEKYAYFKNQFDWRNCAFIFKNPQSARISKRNLCSVIDEEEYSTIKNHFNI